MQYYPWILFLNVTEALLICFIDGFNVLIMIDDIVSEHIFKRIICKHSCPAWGCYCWLASEGVWLKSFVGRWIVWHEIPLSYISLQAGAVVIKSFNKYDAMSVFSPASLVTLKAV